MDISQIDPNFQMQTITRQDVRYYRYNEDPIEINGLYDPRSTGKLWRMPESYVHNETLNPGMRLLIHHTAGGRLRFATNSPYLAVMAELSSISPAPFMPVSGHSGLDVYIAPRGSSSYCYVKSIAPAQYQEDRDRYFTGFMNFSDYDGEGEHEVMIDLPLYNGIEDIRIGIQAGCTLSAPVAYRLEKPICFYGDSITQGACASRPGNNFPNHVSRWLNSDFLNLGFSGNAMGELEMADYIGALDVAAIVVNLELREPDMEIFRSRHYPFYARLREYHPDTPILIMSRAGYPKLRRTNPGSRDFAMSNRIILETCLKGWAEGDENLYYLDGETMFGDWDQDACTADHTHPNDLGFYRMAERILPVMQKMLRNSQ